MLQLFGQLLLRQQTIGTRLAGRLEIAVRRDVLIERHLIGAVPPAPEPVTVPRLVQRDAVDPGAEARLAAESVDGAEDPKEDVLREVERFVAVAEEVDRKLHDHPLVFGDQLGAGEFVASGTALHERRFAAADARPAGNPLLLHREFHYTNFDPARARKFRPAGNIRAYGRLPMKRVLAALALLTLIGSAAALLLQTAARDRQYRALIARGDAALSDEQTFVAIEAYSGAIALRPDSLLPHVRLAETYERRGNLDDASREFRRAANLGQTNTRPYEELGDVRFEQQRFDRAADAYARALQLDDRSARIGYKLAMAEYRNGHVDEALRRVTGSLALDDRSADAQYLLGLCLRDEHRPEDALRAFSRAVARAPAMIAAHEELADTYRDLGRTVDEIDHLRTLAALDRSNVDRQIALGLAHHRAGRSDLAVLTLGEALERRPDDAAVYGALGTVWLDRARDDRAVLKKAREALERAASRPDATSATLGAYGRALLLDGDLDNAARALQLATTRFPVDPQAFLQYAAVLDRQNHLEPARRALAEYAALVSDSSNPQFVALSKRLR